MKPNWDNRHEHALDEKELEVKPELLSDDDLWLKAYQYWTCKTSYYHTIEIGRIIHRLGDDIDFKMKQADRNVLINFIYSIDEDVL